MQNLSGRSDTQISQAQTVRREEGTYGSAEIGPTPSICGCDNLPDVHTHSHIQIRMEF